LKVAALSGRGVLRGDLAISAAVVHCVTKDATEI
jgi:hypothetical protein